MGHFHPENIIDNAFLTDLNIGTNDEWIMERVGIKRRHTVLPLSYIKETHNADVREAIKVSSYTDAQTGALASRLAMKRAGIGPSDVGMVIAGCSAPQYLSPPVACSAAAELGITAPAFDLNSACSTFVFHLHHLLSMQPEKLPDYILVTVVENFTRVVDYSDRRTAVLFGDASIAAVVSPRRPSRMAVNFSVVESDPSGWNKIYVPTGGYFFQEGSAVQAFAIRKTIATLRKVQENIKGDPKNMYFIGHQVNLLMLNNVSEHCGISPTRHLFNVDEFGNCAAAGAPAVLSMNWDKFKKGDEIAMVVVGAGLSWGGLIIQVNE
jgi:3-oxoacyl-[acyl-carrier-protein] synthase-3